MRGLQIGSGFRDSKSGQKGLQTGTALGISIRVKRLQIGAGITNWCRTQGKVMIFLNLHHISHPEVRRNKTSFDFISLFLVLILDLEAYLNISEY